MWYRSYCDGGSIWGFASFVAGDTMAPGVNGFVLQGGDGIRVLGHWGAAAVDE